MPFISRKDVELITEVLIIRLRANEAHKETALTNVAAALDAENERLLALLNVLNDATKNERN